MKVILQRAVEKLGPHFNLDLCTKETQALPSHRRDHDGTRFGAIVALR